MSVCLTQCENSLPSARAAFSTALYSDGETRALTIMLFAAPFGSLGRPIFEDFFILCHKKVDRAYFLCHNKSRINFMPNILSNEKQTTVVSMLAEGNSIRSVERTTGVHRDTIMRLGVNVGEGCAMVMDAKMRNLNCRLLQLDEIWGFVGSKQKNAVRTGNFGDVWTFVA